MSKLIADSINIAYNGKPIVEGLCLRFDKPEITAIIGPNGSGKSTILKAFGRILRPKKGTVLLNNKDIHTLPAKKVARMMSILPQGPQVPDDITVRDLVSYGRSPYQRFFRNGSDDLEIIDWGIRETDLECLSHRQVNTLSGGERQRVWIAMALVQQPQILLLDEPTTFLDIHHQFEIMELLQRLYKRHGITVIMVLHDLNHAARFSHRVIALKQGRVIKDGHPAKVITENVLKDVFGVKARVMTLKDNVCDGSIVCFPYGVCNDKDSGTERGETLI